MTVRTLFRRYLLPFLSIGVLYALAEYLVSLQTTTPEAFWPLNVRTCNMSVLIGISIGLFDLGSRNHFTIQEDCKRLGQDLLFSQEIADGLNNLSGLKVKFMEQTIPRGKEKPVRLYSVVKDSMATLV